MSSLALGLLPSRSRLLRAADGQDDEGRRHHRLAEPDNVELLHRCLQNEEQHDEVGVVVTAQIDLTEFHAL